ncbi:hypothetical protein AAFF_G00282980 [Aldrovandia affinis]|uniref:Uncharacterized protein n=1 Tax=Aldrovandia affinis TaxID=143900 RepID=A0AAD7X103_9TELE|nr:hypothetical protein AAFF_G00282980 [Aldrovandia affinis]
MVRELGRHTLILASTPLPSPEAPYQPLRAAELRGAHDARMAESNKGPQGRPNSPEYPRNLLRSFFHR